MAPTQTAQPRLDLIKEIDPSDHVMFRTERSVWHLTIVGGSRVQGVRLQGVFITTTSTTSHKSTLEDPDNVTVERFLTVNREFDINGWKTGTVKAIYLNGKLVTN